MTYRKIVFATNEFYHIFNKTILSEPIFKNQRVAKRSLNLLNYYRFPNHLSYSRLLSLPKEVQQIRLNQLNLLPPTVSILSFSFMPNHFHLLIKQLQEGGITRFLSNFQNSLAKYFNTMQHREGKLFLEMFKAVHIESEQQLFHVSRYIHLNHITSYLMKFDDLEKYPYTSFCHYSGNIKYDFVDSDLIFSYFKTAGKYKKFVSDQVDYQRKLKLIKDLMIDYPVRY